MADQLVKKMMNLSRLYSTAPFAFPRTLLRDFIRKTYPVGVFVRLGHSRVTGTSSDYCSPQFIEERMKYLTESRDVCGSLQLFENAKSRGAIPHAKTFASLLHLCYSCGRHKDLDHWFHQMQRHYNYIGGGVRATLMNSYCARQEWSKAVEVLESLKAENMLRHTRCYVPLIQGLADAGYTGSAFRLFQEKLEHHRGTSNKDKQLISDSRMLVALIKSCFQLQNTFQNYTRPLLGEEKFNSKETASGDEGLVDVDAHEDEEIRYSRALQVFDFFQNSGNRLQDDVLEAMKEWFQHDPCDNWEWDMSDINSMGICNNCNTKLASGIPTALALQLGNELLCRLSDIRQLGLPSIPDKLCEEFCKFQEFVRETGPFDVIVDGPNVGYLHSSKTFHAHLLKETVLHFTSAGKKVLLLTNVKSLYRGEKPAIESLKDANIVVKNSFGFNDLDILYAAAYSGIGRVFVVTNDGLRDHRLLLPTNVKWTYLRWTRENRITVKFGQGGELQFKRNHFDPALQRTDKAFHIPVTDGTWRCVQKI